MFLITDSLLGVKEKVNSLCKFMLIPFSLYLQDQLPANVILTFCFLLFCILVFLSVSVSPCDILRVIT